ncbi:MAG: hypothetical protein M1839_007444 [Geoglossum umbratile]|nr:MAG: hypothetical protein M1839_007444 [Geoglossum umbratile]
MPTPPPTLPFSEPPWLSSPPSPSPHFTPSHRRFQHAVRAFITANLHDHALEWDAQAHVPEEVFRKFAQANMLVPSLPAPLPGELLRELGLGELMGGVSVEEFDGLHGLIYGDEMARSGILGPSSSLTTGYAVGIPPIVQFGSQQLKDRVLSDLLLGRKRTCLAITEPDAGSDVANIATTAEKSEDGSYYVVSGMKKWITNGLVADYATMAVRTGPPGPAGVSLLLVPLKNQPGITTRPILVASSTNTPTSGTAFITLTSAHIPTINLIGRENHGLSYILSNFTHERLSIAIGATRQARVALSEAMAYCMRREAFGKTLVEQPVVRHRLAKAGALLESLSAWIESVVFQASQTQKQKATTDPADDQSLALSLGGTAALIKAQAGIVLDECARCAVLLFGGNGLTRSGVGERVSKIYRDAPGARIPGGSEDVLLDLGVRQLIKVFRAQKGKLEREAGAKI